MKEGRNGGVLDGVNESWYINEWGVGGGKEKTSPTPTGTVLSRVKKDGFVR